MKKLLVIITLLMAASAFGQGSPGLIPPWQFNSSGRAFIALSSGDTIYAYDTSKYMGMALQGTDKMWRWADSMYFYNYTLSNNAYINRLTIKSFLVWDNSYTPGAITILNPVGPGLQLTSGWLGAVLGSTVGQGEFDAGAVRQADVDSSGQFVMSRLYLGTGGSALAKNQVPNMYRTDSTVMGYPVPTSTPPPDANGLFFDLANLRWKYAAGGTGSGGNVMKYDTGATTKALWTPGTGTIHVVTDTGLYYLKGGGSYDTTHQYVDWNRVQRNDGSRDARVFRTTAGDTLMRMEDSSAATRFITSNTAGWKFNGTFRIGGSLYIDGTYGINGPLWIYGSADGNVMDVSDFDGLSLQGSLNTTDKALTVGSSSNWRFRADTLWGRGANSKITSLGSLVSDTVTTYFQRLPSTNRLVTRANNGVDTICILSHTDGTDSTMYSFPKGKTVFMGPPGLAEIDSVTMHGRIRMYDGTNKSRIDSASQVLADSLTTLPNGVVKLQGSTSGFVKFKSVAAPGSVTYTWPAPTNGYVLQTDASGTLSWVAGGGGGGNSLSNFDTASTPNYGTGGPSNNNLLKGNSDSVLTAFVRRGSNNVYMLPGPGLTMNIGDTVSGCPVMDTSVRVIKNVFFGTGQNDTCRIDGNRAYNLRRNDYYFDGGDISSAPNQLLAKGIHILRFLPDTTDIDTSCTDYLTAMTDSSGASFTPFHFVHQVGEYDSLFSFIINVKSSVADTALAGVTKAVLVINGTPVDSVSESGINFSSLTLTTKTINFADQILSPGDRVLVKLYCRFNPTAATRSVTIRDARLNMRRR